MDTKGPHRSLVNKIPCVCYIGWPPCAMLGVTKFCPLSAVTRPPCSSLVSVSSGEFFCAQHSVGVKWDAVFLALCRSKGVCGLGWTVKYMLFMLLTYYVGIFVLVPLRKVPPALSFTPTVSFPMSVVRACHARPPATGPSCGFCVLLLMRCIDRAAGLPALLAAALSTRSWRDQAWAGIWIVTVSQNALH